MKIVICGSMSFASEMLKTEKILKKLGHKVILPEFACDHAGFTGKGKMPEKKDKGVLIKNHFEEIKKSDAILVLNVKKKEIEGYIGGNSFLEMGFAFVLKKTIYLLNEIPEIGLKDEIQAMSPVVLNRDLSKIKKEFPNSSVFNYYSTLPKKRMGAGVLVFNKDKELLILKPSYQTHWSIPGGVVEKNESPRNACIRETEEEVGLNLKISQVKLLCVDFISSSEEKSENLQFIFYGGILKKEQIKKLKILPEEIEEFKFLQVSEALSLFGVKLRKRIIKSIEALENKTALYLETEF